MEKQKTKAWKAVVWILALTVVVIFAGRTDFSVDSVLSYTPENPVLAGGILLLFYVLKSATVVFPAIVLEITAGHLFSPISAFLINCAGIVILLTVPYLIGYFSGMNTIRKLTRKFSKFEEILKVQQKNSFFLCFFLRIMGCLPGDIVTMYFGATKVPYLQNLIGGFLGILPGLILATVFGSSIQDPASPLFWISILLSAILTVVSVLIYYLYRRRLHRIKEEKES